MNAPITDYVRFGVITRVCEPESGGNMASPLGEIYQHAPGQDGVEVERVAVHVELMLRTPVFVLGEIVILGRDGRETSGRGRKPSKWDVNCEEYEHLEDALPRALQVQTEAAAR